MVLLFSNCRKENVDNAIPFDKAKIVAQFFNVSPGADTEIKALAKHLKKQDSLFNFLPKFVAKNGYPVWDNVAYKTEHQEQSKNLFSTKTEEENSDDKGLFLVPLVDEATHKVKSYLVAKKQGADAYAYQLYNREDLSKTNVSDSLKNNLIQTQAVFGYFEKQINGIDEIEITNPKKTKIKDASINLSIQNKNTPKKNSFTTKDFTCVAIFEVTISYQDTSIEAQEPTVSVSLVYLYCENNDSSGGGGGGDSGDGGGWWDSGVGNPNDPSAPGGGGGGSGDGGGDPIENPNTCGCINPQYYDPFFPWFIPTGYQLTARDYEILNEIEQEDYEADNNISSCYGTDRSGNVRWPGTAEHWLIQYDYITKHPNALREYSIPGSSINGNRGYADIVNLITNEMFEIKPNNTNGITNGINEIELYVQKANISCSPPSGGLWIKGNGYNTTYLPHPVDISKVLEVTLGSPGLILYDKIDRFSNSPQPVTINLPQGLADKLRDFVRELSRNPINIEQKIIIFL